jgi:hypothetical protein
MPLSNKEIHSKATALLNQTGYSIPSNVSARDTGKIHSKVQEILRGRQPTQRMRETLQQAAHTNLPRSRSRSRGGSKKRKTSKRKTSKWY